MRLGNNPGENRPRLPLASYVLRNVIRALDLRFIA
jgi:hypothetical protein